MTVGVSGIIIENDQRAKFRESVYGKPGCATRGEVRDFIKQVVKDAFNNHGVEFKFRWEDAEPEGDDGQA